VNNRYEPAEIEPRWQGVWEETRAFRALNPGDAGFDPEQPKYYVLDMFPYPSGAGLHVGHPMGYIGSDIVSRRKRMEGYNVLHPMGYDAFGLPAEQYAITRGVHPAQSTAKNVETFRRQLRSLGLSYDWSREFSTCDPSYYRWTQWIFARLYDLGLAYRTEVPVWWCEELKTVLANEEVIQGRSERGGHLCLRRPLSQWMLKITEYADRLLDDLETVDWPASVKTMQREWIGRSEGADVIFPIDGFEASLTVFTTRPDTLWGATFMVVAPEHALLEEITTESDREAVQDYVEQASRKSDLERTDLAKVKTGVFTGRYAINPVVDPDTEESRIPIFVADYVLASYGTGAIMAVPAHDERDFEFAKKYNLNIHEVVKPPEGEPGLSEGVCFSGEGTAIHSGPIDGLASPAAKLKTIELLRKRNLGDARVSYRLRDWLFSRQRYWGEPFPVLHRKDGSHLRVPDADLPVELPEMEDFTPADDGAAPLSRASDWVVASDPETGDTVRRDTDTMPGWAGSCWYYLRFMDPQNDEAPFSPEAQEYWGNVDLYIGGVEHAVLHLLYARFWHKVLYDCGLVSTKEPFKRLFNQGLLTAFAFKDSAGRTIPVDEVEERDGTHVKSDDGTEVEQVVAKMSKTLRNVVNPDDVVAQHGVDTFRIYEMFMGPLGESKPWNTRDVPGSRRFLEDVWKLFVDPSGSEPIRPHLREAVEGVLEGEALVLERALNRALKRIEESFETFKFNTAIAAMMEFKNVASKCRQVVTRSQAERFVCAMAPFAPHIAEELWSRLGHAEGIVRAPWPHHDEAYLEEEEYELVVQVNGKLRARVRAPKEADKVLLEELARGAAQKYLAGQSIRRAVVVPGRLVNFVLGS
jgi:leucyl-tRNA synthetase